MNNDTRRRDTVYNDKLPSKFILLFNWMITLLCIFSCFYLLTEESSNLLQSEVLLYMISICVTWMLFYYNSFSTCFSVSTLVTALHLALATALCLSILHNCLIHIDPCSLHIVSLFCVPHILTFVYPETCLWVLTSNITVIAKCLVVMKLALPFFSPSSPSSPSPTLSWTLICLYVGWNSIALLQLQKNRRDTIHLQRKYELVTSYSQENKTALFSQLLGNLAHDLNTVRADLFLLLSSSFFFLIFVFPL